MKNDEENIRAALAAASIGFPGSPGQPHQIASWLIRAMVPLLEAARAESRQEVGYSTESQQRIFTVGKDVKIKSATIKYGTGESVPCEFSATKIDGTPFDVSQVLPPEGAIVTIKNESDGKTGVAMVTLKGFDVSVNLEAVDK